MRIEIRSVAGIFESGQLVEGAYIFFRLQNYGIATITLTGDGFRLQNRQPHRFTAFESYSASKEPMSDPKLMETVVNALNEIVSVALVEARSANSGGGR